MARYPHSDSRDKCCCGERGSELCSQLHHQPASVAHRELSTHVGARSRPRPYYLR